MEIFCPNPQKAVFRDCLDFNTFPAAPQEAMSIEKVLMDCENSPFGRFRKRGSNVLWIWDKIGRVIFALCRFFTPDIDKKYNLCYDKFHKYVFSDTVRVVKGAVLWHFW